MSLPPSFVDLQSSHYTYKKMSIPAETEFLSEKEWTNKELDFRS